MRLLGAFRSRHAGGARSRGSDSLYSKRVWIGPVAFAACSLVVLVALIWYTQRQILELRRDQLRASTRQTAESLGFILAGDREFLQLLAADMASGALIEKGFQDRASRFVASHAELVNIIWIDQDMIVRWGAPFGLTEKTLGSRLSRPVRERALRTAREWERPVYTEHFEVAQGDQGFELHVPVMQEEQFFGTLTAAYSLEKLLRRTIPSSILEQHDVALLSEAGQVIVAMKSDDEHDIQLAQQIPLNPPGHGIALQLSRHASTAWSWSLVILSTLSAALVAAMAFGIGGMRHGITQRRELEKQRQVLEKQLFQAQKMEAIGNLAGNIVHNLNNLLYVITGNTRLAMSELPRSSGSYQELGQALKAGEMAADLLKQIHSFSSPDDEDRKPMLLQPVIKEVTGMLSSLLPATIEIQEEIQKECGPVLANAAKVQQVMLNLCSHASHALKDQRGTIAIGLGEVDVDDVLPAVPEPLVPGRYVKLSIGDSGAGVDPDTQRRIFEPYFTTRRPGAAMGLGLASVFGVVKKQGGVGISGRGVDSRTTFEIYFPLIAWEASLGREEARSVVLIGRGRVMFVDDEEMVARMAKTGLERFGYQVFPFTDGVSALEAFRDDPHGFDIVITDQIMSGMSGIELAKAVLRIRADIPVILTTGFRESVNQKQARAIGIRQFVVKPIRHRDMAEVVRTVLKQAGQMKAEG